MKVGRPLKFESVKVLEEKIEEYLKWAQENNKPLTVERLCSDFLDCSKQCLYDYKGKEEFFDPIKRVIDKIEAAKVEKLHTQNNVAGLIFDLKNNHKWSDNNNLKISGDSENPLQLVIKHYDGDKE